MLCPIVIVEDHPQYLGQEFVPRVLLKIIVLTQLIKFSHSASTVALDNISFSNSRFTRSLAEPPTLIFDALHNAFLFVLFNILTQLPQDVRVRGLLPHHSSSVQTC